VQTPKKSDQDEQNGEHGGVQRADAEEGHGQAAGAGPQRCFQGQSPRSR